MTDSEHPDHTDRPEERPTDRTEPPAGESAQPGGSWPFAGPQPQQPSEPPRPSYEWAGPPQTQRPSLWGQPQGQQHQYGYQPYGQPYATEPPAQPERPPRRRTLTPVLLTAVVVAALLGGAAGALVNHQLGGGTKKVVSALAAPPAQNTAAQKAPAGSVQKVAAAVLPSVVSITVTTQSGGDEGSGIVLSSDGDILTNNHVIAAAAGGSGQISVTFSGGKTVSGSIVGRDTVTDLAVVRAKGVSKAQPAQLGSSGELVVGQPVVAIGSPLGLSGTVTSGIVSALQRPVTTSDSDQNGGGAGSSGQAGQETVIDAVQTDAAINPGNSGGALVNMSGQVVGINQSIATVTTGSFGGSSQSGSIGVGFAIPLDEARPIANQLLAGKKATHAQLGVSVTNATTSSGVPNGAKLDKITAGKAATKAGLKAGDVVTKIGSREIDSSDALVAAVRSHRPGDTVTLTYTRAGSSHTASATLGSDG